MKKPISLILMLLIFLIINNRSSAQMYWNAAGSFAGNSNSYTCRGSSASLNITGSFTLEAWVNPASVSGSRIILQKREGGDPVGYTLLLVDGRVSLRTNSSTRLIGKTVLQTNTWTHISGTYNSLSGLFTVFINGMPDTSAVNAGSAPLTNPDSLFIGKGFNNPFNGQMDDVRIWNRALSTDEVYQFSRLSLGTNTGIYSGLVLSLTFQKNNGDGVVFSLNDMSGNANHFVNRGISTADLSNRLSQTTDINSCIELNGNNQYLAAPDDMSLTPVASLTLEAWIFPRSFNSNNLIIHKGSDNGASVDYNLKLNQGKLETILNNNQIFSSDDILPLNQWSHVAFTFDAASDINTFYLNGKIIDTGNNYLALLNNGPDSIYIGGTMALNDFDGYIDEVRIKLSAKSSYEINRFMFKSIDEANDLSGTETVYNLDGNTESSVGNSNKLFIRNSGKFSYSGTTNDAPLSPLVRADALNFNDGFYLKTSGRRIPETGTSGSMISDTLSITFNEIILDINVFVAINHSAEDNLSISLIDPNGLSSELYSTHTLSSNHDNLVTIFDDQAAGALISSNYVSFAPAVKPINNLNSVFSGGNTQGQWKLVVNDLAAGDTGRLYGWGIQFNNNASIPTSLMFHSLIQGFYNSSVNQMVRDTMKLYVRNYAAPFNIVDSSRRYLAGSGYETFLFSKVVRGVNYFLQLKHRNSIETWSSSPINFDPLTSQAVYDFRGSASQAFGNNMVIIDSYPLQFGIYSGDVNQDRAIDLTDLISIFNDGSVFSSGYIPTDVNGDTITDLTDMVITFNNASSFIVAVTP